MLPGWLYTTTRNVAVDFVRTEQRRRAREQEAHTMHKLTSTPPPDVWEQLRPMLEDVMDELNEADREIIVLRYFARRPFTAIGTALNLTEDTARMRVERALDKLHALLTHRGVTSTAAALAAVLTNQAVAMAPANLATTVTTGAVAGVSASGFTVLAANAVTFRSMSKIAVSIVAAVAAIGIGCAFYEAKIAEQTATVPTQNIRAVGFHATPPGASIS